LRKEEIIYIRVRRACRETLDFSSNYGIREKSFGLKERKVSQIMTIKQADLNRRRLLNRALKGKYPDMNPRTLALLKKPVTQFMRPQEESYPFVKVCILGKGIREVAASREVLV
jgi:hypothetical protein